MYVWNCTLLKHVYPTVQERHVFIQSTALQLDTFTVQVKDKPFLIHCTILKNMWCSFWLSSSRHFWVNCSNVSVSKVLAAGDALVIIKSQTLNLHYLLGLLFGAAIYEDSQWCCTYSWVRGTESLVTPRKTRLEFPCVSWFMWICLYFLRNFSWKAQAS